jgi:hypothetical protein
MLNGFRITAAGALAAALVTIVSAQDSPDRVVVPFSDPSRPGTLKVHLLNGSLTVRGGAVTQVTIEGRARGEDTRRSNPPPAGMRRLTQRGGFNVEEEGNTMLIGPGGMNRPMDLEIQVPARTNLNVATVNSGTITIEGVDGDLEVDNVNGPITLTGVAGSVVAHSVNGKVLATMTRVTAEKAMAFTSLNGIVDVTLPQSTKATVKMRSDRGDVYTDFDLQMKTPPAAGAPADKPRSGGPYRIEVDHSIYGTINGGGPEFELRTFNGDVFLRRGK